LKLSQELYAIINSPLGVIFEKVDFISNILETDAVSVIWA
jgi:hypothetical protein